MSTYIFKYEIPITHEAITMELPEGFVILDIGNQGHKIFMWCNVDIQFPIQKYVLRIFGTGQPLDNINEFYFLKTVIMPNDLVWHIFHEKLKNE